MKINCIIPSAGAGSRFKELGRAYPKSILPYNGKPIIQYNIESVYDYVEEITIVVKRNDLSTFHKILSMYPTFDKINFNVPDENNNTGPLTSIWAGVPTEGCDYVLIILSDIIVDAPIPFETRFVSYQEVDKEPQRWCVVEESNGGLIYHDKSMKDESSTHKALNGIYFVSYGDFMKIEQIINEKTNSETQISHWLVSLNGLDLIELPVTDFGTIDEYIKERKFVKCRHFNQILTSQYLVTKSSIDNNKIFKEYSWFKSIPTELSKYTARIFENGFTSNGFSYTMEQIWYPTLREHILFKGLDEIELFLNQMKDFIEIERSYVGDGNMFFKSLFEKTESRMSGIFTEEEISLMKSKLAYHEDVLSKNGSIMHGDLVASNIFYNEITSEIKVIDPRGDLYGSFIYDLAKMNQSFTTPYDYIDAGLHVNGFIYQKHQDKYKRIWRKFLKENYQEFVDVIDVVTLSLMCSLIPLHSDTIKNQELYIKWCKENLK